MEVPDKAVDGVRGPGEPLGSFTKKCHHNWTTSSMLNGNFSKIWPMGAGFRLQDPPN